MTEDDTFRVLTRPSLPELTSMIMDFLSSLGRSDSTMTIVEFVESKGYTFDEWENYQLGILQRKIK